MNMKPRKAIETSPLIHLLLHDSPPDTVAGTTESGDKVSFFLISKRSFNSLLFSAYYELRATSAIYSFWDTEKY